MVGFQPHERFAIEGDAAGRWGQEAAEEVETRGFSGAVRADETDDFAGIDGNVHPVDGGEPAEIFGQISCFQKSHTRLTSHVWVVVCTRVMSPHW